MGRKSERKRIRHKIAEILKTADIPGVGQAVFSQKSIPSDHDELPAILIYQKSESVSRNDESPKVYQRNLSITIEIQSTHDDDLKLTDELDDIAQAVEDIIEGSDDLMDMTHADSKEKLLNDFDLTETQIDLDGSGSNPTGSARLTYNFEYYTNEDRPKILHDFKKMESTFSFNKNKDKKSKSLDILED
jgi:hypothetical protein